MILVKKSEITKITMIDNEHNDFCVIFHLGDDGRRGQIILPCYYTAEFPLDDPNYADQKELQLRLTQQYLDQYPDNAYVELSASLLYDMNVYH